MKHPFGIFLLTFVALAFAYAKPARPVYEPPEPLDNPTSVVDLNGTAWDGIYRNQELTYLFEDGGVLSYLLRASRWPNRGTWKLERDTVYFEMFKKRLEFTGAFKDRDTIVGEIRETDGKRFPLTLTRNRAVKK